MTTPSTHTKLSDSVFFSTRQDRIRKWKAEPPVPDRGTFYTFEGEGRKDTVLHSACTPEHIKHNQTALAWHGDGFSPIVVHQADGWYWDRRYGRDCDKCGQPA